MLAPSLSLPLGLSYRPLRTHGPGALHGRRHLATGALPPVPRPRAQAPWPILALSSGHAPVWPCRALARDGPAPRLPPIGAWREGPGRRRTRLTRCRKRPSVLSRRRAAWRGRGVRGTRRREPDLGSGVRNLSLRMNRSLRR